MPKISLPFSATEAQLPAVTSSAERKCLGGARGGGKSASLGGKAATSAVLNPGCEYVMMRADLADFKKSTLIELEKFLPRGQYTHHKTNSVIEVQTIVPGFPSRIWYVEGKDPGSIKSSNLAGVYVDEGEEVPFATWMNATGSIRASYPKEIWGKINPVTGREFGKHPPFEGVVATNPAPCWIADLFPVLDEELGLFRTLEAADPFFDPVRSPSKDYPDKQIDSNFLYVPFLARDNPYNPPGYWEQLIEDYKHDPVLLARNVYGRWDISMQGLVYQLQREHRWYSEVPGKRLWLPNHPVVVGVDPSNGAGTYAAVILQFVNGRVFQIDEWGGSEGQIDEDFRDWLHAQPYAKDVQDVIVDSAKADTIERLRRLGLPARPCLRKEVTGQINALKAAMFIDPAKGYAPYVMDEARCPKTRDEFAKRVYKKPSDRNPDLRVSEQPVKAHDHFLNALEYVVFDKMPVAGATGGQYRKAVRQVPGGRFQGRSFTTDRNYRYFEDLNTLDGPRYNHLYRPAARR